MRLATNHIGCKLRCRESVSVLRSKIKIDTFIYKRILGAVPKLSILYKFRQSSIQKEHVCYKYFVGISAKKEQKKEKSCSEESLWNI